MFKQLVSLTAVAALSLTAAIACTKSSGAEGNSTGSGTAATAPNSGVDSTGAYTPGTAAHSSDIVSMTVFATDGNGAATAEQLDPIFAKYPDLATHVKTLDAIDRAVFTTDSNIELYEGDALVMALSLKDNVASVIWSRDSFAADHIAYASDASAQKEMVSDLTFDLSSCTAAPEKGQDQDQGQDKGQDKGTLAMADKAPVADKDQGQDQDQSQGKIEEKPECQTLSVVLDMKEQEVKQEQGQDKGQDKAPVADKDQGQDQDQGKAPIEEKKPVEDKGQDKTVDQDQGQDKAPAPAEQDKTTDQDQTKKS